jgi:hypothetical protein
MRDVIILFTFFFKSDAIEEVGGGWRFTLSRE